jgi:hypothetical protein
VGEHALAEVLSRPAYLLGCRVQAIGPSGAGAGLWIGTLAWDMTTSVVDAGRSGDEDRSSTVTLYLGTEVKSDPGTLETDARECR